MAGTATLRINARILFGPPIAIQENHEGVCNARGNGWGGGYFADKVVNNGKNGSPNSESDVQLGR
jgi:hypothetical protein